MIALTQYAGKYVAVFGLGKAGSATIASLLEGGAKVIAWDDNQESRSRTEAEFATHVSLMPPTDWDFRSLEALILSPGVPLTHPVPHVCVKLAHQAGCRVIGDIELLREACPQAYIIAITGTNGKSTTTALLGHVLKSAGRKVETGGNLGIPALSLAPLGKMGCYVLELSSYQLDLIDKAAFNAALLLNVTPDHLDRHGDMNGYIAAKKRIFMNQKKGDVAIVGVDDEYTRTVADELAKRKGGQKLIPVTVQRVLEDGVFVADGMLTETKEGKVVARIDLNGIQALTGRHNWQNAAMAHAALRNFGLSLQEIEVGMRSFPGLAHRMELVATIDGIRFINDSKATNADATSNALAPYDPIYWILGGKAKEGGIASLGEFFPKIAHAFLIGAAEAEFAATLEGKVPYTKCKTLQAAFDAASAMALKERKKDGVVLLSPACASFDQWKDFEQRGDAFRSMAQALRDKAAPSAKKSAG